MSVYKLSRIYTGDVIQEVAVRAVWGHTVLGESVVQFHINCNSCSGSNLLCLLCYDSVLFCH
jgi:hypothetical protein